MRMIYPILGIVMLALVGCSATPEAAPTAVPAATAAAAATSTVRTTDLPSPTATASPAPSWTATATFTPTATPEPTATATSAPAALDLATWEMPIIAAGVTLKVIGELEATAAGLQDGSLASTEAGGTLLGLQIGLGVVAQALEERPPAGRAARFTEDLQAAMRTVYGIIERWQQGELSSATVGPELAAARADAERLLSDLGRAAGLSPAQVAELLATMDEP